MSEVVTTIGQMLAESHDKWREGQDKKSWTPPNGEHACYISKTFDKEVKDRETKQAVKKIFVIATVPSFEGGDDKEFVLCSARLDSEWGMLAISQLAEFLTGGLTEFKTGDKAWAVIEKAQEDARSLIVSVEPNPKNPDFPKYKYIQFTEGDPYDAASIAGAL